MLSVASVFLFSLSYSPSNLYASWSKKVSYMRVKLAGNCCFCLYRARHSFAYTASAEIPSIITSPEFCIKQSHKVWPSLAQLVEHSYSFQEVMGLNINYCGFHCQNRGFEFYTFSLLARAHNLLYSLFFNTWFAVGPCVYLFTR